MPAQAVKEDKKPAKSRATDDDRRRSCFPTVLVRLASWLLILVPNPSPDQAPRLFAHDVSGRGRAMA